LHAQFQTPWGFTHFKRTKWWNEATPPKKHHWTKTEPTNTHCPTLTLTPHPHKYHDFSCLKGSASFCYCASRDIQISWGICPLEHNNIFAWFMTVEKADLSKGCQNPERKLGITIHFSKITELKFVKKLPYIFCILTPFLENAWLPTFFFLDSNNPC